MIIHVCHETILLAAETLAETHYLKFLKTEMKAREIDIREGFLPGGSQYYIEVFVLTKEPENEIPK